MAATNQDSYSCTEAGKLLGVSARRVRQLAEEGRLGIVQKSPLRVSALEVIALKENRPEKPGKSSSSGTNSALPLELLKALEGAREAGAREARNALELVQSELRERAERAEQRAAEAEAARLVSESNRAALEARLEEIKAAQEKKPWFRKFS